MVKSSCFLTACWGNKAGSKANDKGNVEQRTAIVWEKGESRFFPFLPEQICWQDFHHLMAQVANFLSSLPSFSQAQLIGYQGSHRLIGLLSYCAVMALNKKILMLNPSFSSEKTTQLCEQYGVQFLITDQLFTNFDENLTACELPTLDHASPATLTLTSGSSGSPKAVVHSIKNHLANAEGVCELLNFKQDDSWLLSLPLFHVSGQGIVWRWLSQGATLYVNEDKADFFKLLSQVSHASLVPTQLQRYLASEELHKRSKKQTVLLGGAAIPAELVQQAKVQGITTFSGYGMTEMASTICAVKDELDNVGKPLAGREIHLVENEIWVKGNCLALGYWQKNGEIRPLTNEQGWLQTKDLGCWNEKGHLIIRGRLDNMFISGGENIQPEEVEKVLFASGLLRQIFIVPIADAEFGERPVAVVDLLEPFSTQAVEKLQNFATQHLERFKHPICYLPLDENLQQGGIKISRQQLKAEVAVKLGLTCKDNL